MACLLYSWSQQKFMYYIVLAMWQDTKLVIPGPTGAKAVYQSGQPNLITIGSGWNYKNKAKWAKDDELFRHFEAKNFISLSHDFKCVMIAG